MIKSITITNRFNESIELELENPWGTGLAITGVDGLGPVKASINTTDLAFGDGSVYNSSKAQARNIVFYFRLLEDSETQMVETTRLKTYRYFPLKSKINIKVTTTEDYINDKEYWIDGYVESNEPDIFQKEETANISIICPQPYFRSNDVEINFYNVTSLFEFPFSNESTTERTIVLSEYDNSLFESYIYEGTIDTGCLFRFDINGNVRNIELTNETTNENMKIDTGKIRNIIGGSIDDLITGDILYLSTIFGNKYLKLIRDGIEYNILGALPKDTQWITVVSGLNNFLIESLVGQTNINVQLKTNILYEGV